MEYRGHLLRVIILCIETKPTHRNCLSLSWMLTLSGMDILSKPRKKPFPWRSTELHIIRWFWILDVTPQALYPNPVYLKVGPPGTQAAFYIFTWEKTRQIWGIWKLRPAYSPKTPNLCQNRWCFVPCDLQIWWMTLENNRASLLCCFKLCAAFHSHWWIQTGVIVRDAQFGSNLTIFRAVWPCNLTYDLEKQ